MMMTSADSARDRLETAKRANRTYHMALLKLRRTRPLTDEESTKLDECRHMSSVINVALAQLKDEMCPVGGFYDNIDSARKEFPREPSREDLMKALRRWAAWEKDLDADSDPEQLSEEFVANVAKGCGCHDVRDLVENHGDFMDI